MPFIAGAGLLTDIGGRIWEGAGGRDVPAYQISPYAEQGLRTGVEGATAGLEATPAIGSESVLDAYRQSADRLYGLEVPEGTIDPEEMTQRILEAAAQHTAPIRAEGRRQAREAAGFLGPSTATGQQFAASEAESENYLNRILAELEPQLASQRFNQDVERFRSAIGLEQARQGAVMDPYQIVNAIRQGYTGQLLGAGSPAASVPNQYRVPAGGSTLQGAGQTALQLPTSLALASYLRGGTGSGTVAGTGAVGAASSGSEIPSGFDPWDYEYPTGYVAGLSPA
jgi:hypothetical protein